MEQVRIEPDQTVVIRPRYPLLFDTFAEATLTWWEEHGIGYYPVKAGIAPYDEEYFKRYQRQADTEIGRKLMSARVGFVNRHYPARTLIDIGIGSGAFIEARRNTFGYDVNPFALQWLGARSLYWNINNGAKLPSVSFWDVLEHIHDFHDIVNRVEEWVFVSIPIFENAAHVLRSKHYRKDEHVWYFTADGLIRTFNWLGFDCVEHNYQEELIGREDIGSFAFRRKE